MIKKWLSHVKNFIKSDNRELGSRFVKRPFNLSDKESLFLARQYEMGTTVSQDRVTAYILYAAAYFKGNQQAGECMQLLEAKLLANEYQEAQAIIKKFG